MFDSPALYMGDLFGVQFVVAPPYCGKLFQASMIGRFRRRLAVVPQARIGYSADWLY
jgi:hypothetical protein